MGRKGMAQESAVPQPDCSAIVLGVARTKNFTVNI